MHKIYDVFALYSAEQTEFGLFIFADLVYGVPFETRIFRDESVFWMAKVYIICDTCFLFNTFPLRYFSFHS